MNLSIDCSTFVRLASICDYFEPDLPLEIKDKINTIRIMVNNSKIIALVTNQKIAAVEYLGSTTKPDCHFDLVLCPKLIEQAKSEMPYDSKLNYEIIPEIAMATVSTTFGYVHDDNACYWFDNSPLDKWRNWVPQYIIPVNKGAMVWDVFHIESLVKSSPSGEVVFPEQIDSTGPVCIRDVKNSNWMGVFIPKSETNPNISATIPVWL